MATQPESGLIAQEFAALLGYLRRSGCSFRACLALGGTPRGVAFRYDIHRRDLPAAHDFLALHLRVGIPATFFLLWDYSPLERKRLDQFLGFAAKAKAPVEIGLHDSPVDAWLIESDFAGDRKAYVVWTQSAALPEWLAGLRGAAGRTRGILRASAGAFRRACPNAHGSSLARWQQSPAMAASWAKDCEGTRNAWRRT